MKSPILFFVSILIIGNLAQAGQSPKLDKIVRDRNGSLSAMNPMNATAYCAGLGMHLPSAREMAEFSTSLGATGIKEINEFPNEEAARRANYVLIKAQNSDGKMDSFYFNHFGYDRPDGDLGRAWLTTSSVDPIIPVNHFAFSSASGGIYRVTGGGSLRCALSHE